MADGTDGYDIVTSAGGAGLVARGHIDAPWAKDAKGNAVPVAALLGPAAKVTENHGPGKYREDDRGFGCGCEIRFEHRGQAWNFHRGNSSWDLVREQDGEALEDGSTFYQGWNGLGPTGSTAHPQHLVTLIRAKLAEAS
ncbi:hypothetical protein ACIF8W_35085 [Streptomyces sp. NPDC085639]|uniref:hypothetical protein n=1 Tax=Streptomyces sp. NPDC085639 TaxID=3365734 RepID=UPI0037D3E8FF